ncbi:hypothetical protein LZ30DRAFT_180892 [Colletotrichum cereale]|nr:hypothetical protein LZ30DRAFT_180892 [Colletotrichum cereale]
MLWCDIESLDDETLHVLLQIQLEDLEVIKRSSKGKGREDDISDADLAFESYESELRSRIVFASDKSMCRSIAKANHLDGRLIATLTYQEKQVAHDRDIALRLSRGEAVTLDPFNTHASQAYSPFTDIDTEYLQKLKFLYGSKDAYDDVFDQAESSEWAASRQQTAGESKREKRECESCMTSYASNYVARCPCGHEYCQDCLHTIFNASLTDESLFPPRCCGEPIPVEDSRRFLTPELIGRFRAKELEFTMPNRTYCHMPNCSTFIPKEFIKADIATCPRHGCMSRTCVMCKGAEHGSQDCSQDTLTQDLLRLAGERGWQRCYSCRRVLELEYGCLHMTCPCKAQFCYSCGQRWKTCNCVAEPRDEQRLYDRPNGTVNRNTNAVIMNPMRRF